MKHLYRFASFFALVCASAMSAAQSINIDFDLQEGPGAGVPSWDFGGVPNQAGLWNSIEWYPSAQLGRNHVLKGLDGQILPVSLLMVDGGGRGTGGGGAQNTGNFGLLLGDYVALADPGLYVFQGLQNGNYRVVTYTRSLNTFELPVTVHVFGSLSPSPQLISGGTTLGNVFVLGRNYTDHLVNVVDGVITIRTRSRHSGGFVSVTGMQIVRIN